MRTKIGIDKCFLRRILGRTTRNDGKRFHLFRRQRRKRIRFNAVKRARRACNSFRLKTERHIVQVEFKNPPFRKFDFKAKCAQHFTQLYTEIRLCRTRINHADKLHGDCRSSAYNAAGFAVLFGSTYNRKKINADVPIKVFIFRRNKCVCKLRRYFFKRHELAP